MAEEVKATMPETAAAETGTGFKPIDSQEALDAIIKDRLERKEASVRKEYEGYIKPDDYNAKLEELKEAKKKVSDYETSSAKKAIAAEFGIPEDLSERLHGKNAKEWRKDAEALAPYFRKQYPSRSNINVDASDGDEMKELLRQLRGA